MSPKGSGSTCDAVHLNEEETASKAMQKQDLVNDRLEDNQLKVEDLRVLLLHWVPKEAHGDTEVRPGNRLILDEDLEFGRQTKCEDQPVP